MKKLTNDEVDALKQAQVRLDLSLQRVSEAGLLTDISVFNEAIDNLRTLVRTKHGIASGSAEPRKWIISDWMSGICFDGKTFDSFEEAWEFIYVTDPEPAEGSPEWRDHWYDDYFVKKVDA